MVKEEKRKFLKFLAASFFVVLLYLLLGKQPELNPPIFTKDDSVTVKVEDGALVIE